MNLINVTEIYCNKKIGYYDLKEEEWKKDVIPEIIDGKNIFDFIDPEILERLETLEREEEEMMAKQAMEDEMRDDDDVRYRTYIYS